MSSIVRLARVAVTFPADDDSLARLAWWFAIFMFPAEALMVRSPLVPSAVMLPALDVA